MSLNELLSLSSLLARLITPPITTWSQSTWSDRLHSRRTQEGMSTYLFLRFDDEPVNDALND